ncbi:aldolase [Meredithblackwellia eburnea MCA 4105]
MAPARPFVPGIHVPVFTFWTEAPEQELDLVTYKEHIKWIAGAGVASIVALGSSGEAATVTLEERNEICRATRSTLDEMGLDKMPVVMGSAPQSLGEAVLHAKEAAKNGGDYLLSLMPHFWAPTMTKDAIKTFFTSLADQSPIPIIIYSYPSVNSGLELDSDDIGELALHANIHAVKQTDHNVGKMARIGKYSSVAKKAAAAGTPWMTIAGATDYLAGAVALGGEGAITGQGNCAPLTCVKLWELLSAGKYEEAREIQSIVSAAEWSLSKSALPGHKVTTCVYRKYPKSAYYCRAPVPLPNADIQAWVNERMLPIMELEMKLQAEAGKKGVSIPSLTNGSA